MENSEKAMLRLQKVLNLLEGAKTEGEAKAASLKLQELLLKSDLTIEELRSSMAEAEDAEVIESKVSIGTSSGARWQACLADVIAGNYRCDTYNITQRSNGRAFAKWAVFVGEKDDAELAEKVFAVTLVVASRLYKRWCKDTRAMRKEEAVMRLVRDGHSRTGAEQSFKSRGLGWTPTTAERNGWYLGFVRGLKEAYAEQVASSEELSMALVKPKAVRDRMEEIAKGFTPQRCRRRGLSLDAAAVEAGRSTGAAYGSGTALAS